jgi:hypothetical protein
MKKFMFFTFLVISNLSFASKFEVVCTNVSSDTANGNVAFLPTRTMDGINSKLATYGNAITNVSQLTSVVTGNHIVQTCVIVELKQ